MVIRRLSKSIGGWNIHMVRSRNRKFFSGLCAQREGVSAVLNDSRHKKYCNVFKNKVHVAANLRLCTVKFHLS